MNAMIERLKEYAKFKGISFSDMERSLGKSRGYLSIVKNMSTDVLEKACEIYTDLSCEWIVRGQGEMIAKQQTEAAQSDKKNEVLLAKLEQAQKRIINLEIELELKNA